MAGALRSVELRSATRFFGRHVALYRCSLKLVAGEVLAVLGPNGAGKSTLAGLLATTLAPSEGEVVAAADRPLDSSELRARVGWVSHESMLQRELTGREQLALIAGLYGVASERVAFWLERVRLTADADRAIGTYSRGMRQRLALARALLSEPELVLLDEPTTGLDAASREVLWELIGDLRAAGRIVVVITHDLDAPPELFTRAIVLSQGRLVADRGAPESLSALYAAALQRVAS